MSSDTPRHPGVNLGHYHPDLEGLAEETVFGFWVFLMSDAIIFALMFATYGIMFQSRAGGPGPHELFDIRSAFIETLLLLTSSFTYGQVSLAMKYEGRSVPLLRWLVVTFALGVAFLGFEIHDFLTAVEKGGSPDRSGFLSSYFGLVSLHGMHVTVGLIWMLAIVAQLAVYGLDGDVKLSFLRLGLFWHFLDIVWVGIFTVVYLGGLAS
jgi:cytochrome o ubiquinol oxidase subunit III